MDDAKAEFDAHDMELIAQAQRETEAAEAAAATEEVKADDEAAPAPAEAPATAPAAPAAPAAAPAPAEAPAAAPAAPAAVDAHGNVKAALRASRHQERVLRQEVETLRRQVEASGTAATPSPPAEPDESQLTDVREYAPDVGKHYDALKAELAELRQRVSAAPAPTPEFAPEAMPDDVQAAIDEVPELLRWQISAEHQDKWQAAKDADRLLARSTKWDDKPFTERFAAAVALVNVLGAAPSKASPAALEDAMRVIAAAASAPAGAVTVGDLRGGASPASTSIPDYQAMVKRGDSDEDIMASLPALP